MKRETDIIIRTPVGNTENIQVKEVVKQSKCLEPSCTVQKHPQLTALEKK